MTILRFDAMSGSLPQARCALGGEGMPTSEDAGLGERISWKRALERASVSVAVAAPSATSLTWTNPLVPMGQARSAASMAESVSPAAAWARTGALAQWRSEPVRAGEDPAFGAHSAGARRRHHAGPPMAEPCPSPLGALSSVGANEVDVTRRVMSAHGAEARRFAFDAATVRVHVETEGNSASVWIGVDSGSTHLLDDAVAAVSRWLMREGCCEARWVCNGRPLESLRLGRTGALASYAHGGSSLHAGSNPRPAGDSR